MTGAVDFREGLVIGFGLGFIVALTLFLAGVVQ